MDYQKFIQHLPELYENWGQESLRPKSNQFQSALEQIKGLTTPNVMQLLNWAVECLEEEEIYCEIGCFHGSTLIGALLNHPDRVAYAVDNFSEFYNSVENFEQLNQNLAQFNLDEQVFFCNQDFEEFFWELREIEPQPKIGVYFYDGAHDYRSQLLGLLLAKPFLAQRALIIVDDSNWSAVQQANWDFMAAHPQVQLLLDLPTNKHTSDKFWNGIQIFSWDSNLEHRGAWSNFTKEFRHQPFIKSIYNFSLEFESTAKKQALDQIYQEAATLHQSGQLLAAEQKYQEVLQWAKNHAHAWHDLGMVYYAWERYQDALNMLLRSLKIDPGVGEHLYSLGLVLEKIGNLEQAIGAYQKAINLNPQLVDAYNDLGNIWYKLGNFQQAESIYRQAIATNSTHFGSYLNLGNVLMIQDKIQQAIEIYQQSLLLKPEDADILHNLGVAFAAIHDQAQSALYFGYAAHNQGKYQEAIAHYQEFLKLQTGDIYFYIKLTDCYKKLNQPLEAIKAYQQAIKQDPNSSELYLRLLTELQYLDQVQLAIELATQALQLLPNNISLKLENTRLLPIIYKNVQEINFYRERFSQNLKNLIKTTPLDSLEDIDNALAAISHRTNFFLQYQCQNDLALQSLYGQFVHRIMTTKYPQWAKPLSMPINRINEKIRLGYVSSHLRNHNGAKWALGWIKNHHKQAFEIYCYYTDYKQDQITQEFQTYSDVFHHIPANLEAVCQQIATDKLDIIVYTDIGMEPLTTAMAGLRLAPIQCTAWGHPVTSGYPTIDYYLSSELMEPENADEHYSEKLIRLPNLGISYPQPILPKDIKNKADFQLRDDAIIYLSGQSLFKYLPQYDYIFPTIVQHVPNAQFVFLASQLSDSVTEQFWQRLKTAFANFGLDSQEYCLVLSRLNHQEYLNLNLLADIFLDTLGWSGGNTTLEAIACNLPVVTCPGEFMRGRHSYGILQMLGVRETIAKNEAEYIDIAVRLATDQNWQENIVQRIIQNKHRVYDDKTCVEALENFYRHVVQL